ncbi:hypothetical protein EI555_018646, partial [Monodon monoceros]
MGIAAHQLDRLNTYVTWSDIGGLNDVIMDLKDTKVLFLYVPPCCGRTLITKATAKKAGCFLNLQPSTLAATAMMKAQLMSLWDGLGTDHRCQVIVMGATNHPQDFDSDIIGKMPMRFHVNQPVPNKPQ